ncbi:MAG: DUF4231 domain-containing protein [Symploca sp. SIO3C6]|nr:DUF4231 domain-containing protein [Symploca sp. SIO3C6]
MKLEVKATNSPPPSSVLQHAWERQSTYGKNAKASQSRFFCLRIGILVLSVLATLLAVTHSVIGEILGNSHAAIKVIHLFLLLVPIILSVLLAGAVKFDKGNNWILLRGSAELLKKEIYCYRARVGNYSDLNSRDALLANKVKLISQRLKGTPIHYTSLSPYEGEVLSKNNLFNLFKGKGNKPQEEHNKNDDKFSDLTATNYLKLRLEDQFNWYRKKTRQLDKQLHYFQWGVYILGGIGTFLVAVKQEIWVAVSTVLAAVFSSFLEIKRVEATLIAYNQAADDLYDISTWWSSLSDQAKLDNFELLVLKTETTIQSENAGWVQEMNDALTELYGETKKLDTESSHEFKG